ncbi:DedA family protein [Ruegeria sp. Ofav3-42]|uniref:DedA family protein n=1 Tax=Ruegeria sp. Ofav3-42 TaxID=2917759 RepID=UPI001EF5B376|nr:DedA family protein [Ruegeria sp. Ofav3-42]MCG7522560.1 DedA family protein [Ruegeria sp. Ofav3-42]
MHHFADNFENLIENYGLFVLFPTIFFETFGLPLPGESALVATSALAAKGTLNIFAVAAVAILAAIAGDNVAYLIGRRYGRAIILAYGSRFGITQTKYDSVERATNKYGAYVVVCARFFVLLRQLNGLVAGSANMPWIKFFLANVAGSVLWVLFWTTIAYQFGHRVSLLPDAVHHLSLIGAVLVPVTLVLVFVFGRRALLKRKALATKQP